MPTILGFGVVPVGIYAAASMTTTRGLALVVYMEPVDRILRTVAEVDRVQDRARDAADQAPPTGTATTRGTKFWPF